MYELLGEILIQVGVRKSLGGALTNVFVHRDVPFLLLADHIVDIDEHSRKAKLGRPY
jgi:hypothetical protein